MIKYTLLGIIRSLKKKYNTKRDKFITPIILTSSLFYISLCEDITPGLLVKIQA